MSSQSSSYTYMGLWTNWSHGPVRGFTLTLSSHHAGLLTAFIALFVAIAGGALWRITAFIFHQLRAGQGVHDGLHHQQQAIFRNTSSPGAALWQFTHLSYFWWPFAQRPVWRSVQFSFVALLSLAMLAVASLFSSQLTRMTSNETLVLSDNCGIWSLETSLGDGFANRAYHYKVIQDTLSASGYARACYGNNPDRLQCNRFVQEQIHSTDNRNATCPFASGICMMSDTAAYELDSGPIDSHVHLGINTPEIDRVIYRRRETCAPLNMTGYSTKFNVSKFPDSNETLLGQPGDEIRLYNFGPAMDKNWTYSYNTRARFGNFGYTLS